MKPTDPRLRAPLAAARTALLAVVVSGSVTSLLVIVHAFALAALVVAVVEGGSLTGPVLLLGTAWLLRILSSSVGDLAAARAATRVSARLRRDLATAVVGGRTAGMTEGEVAALATRGVTAAEPYVTRYLPAVLLAALLPPLTVLAIASQDLISAAIVLATVGLVPVFGALIGLATRDRAEGQWRAMASLSGHFVDVMRGLPTLVAFGRAEAQSRSIRATAERYRRSTMATLRIAFASAAVLELVATLSVAIVAVVVGTRLAAGGMDLRTALVVLLLAPEAYWPLRRVGAEFHAAAEGVATFERLSELTVSPGPGDARSDFAGPITVRAVSYSYPGRGLRAIENLSASFLPGEITAVTGPSGCGKSTLLALLAGLITPTDGTVRIGSTPATAAAWPSQVAWVPQRPSFLDASIAANLRIAAPSASDADLWAALEQVALSERVRAAGGLDAEVGEDGIRFSAGERARLALARAVLARRPWVVLDEPTAHLDAITQRVMLDVIRSLARTSGVVVVAHEPAVVAIADRIVALTAADVPAPVPADPANLDRGVAAVVPESGPPDPARGGFATSTLLGILASASGVALTATAGWLIVTASAHPPVLTMLVAIVGVRAFGLGRPVFRYAERLRSHDAALRRIAARRVEVYETITPLTPGRLGLRRGDVLSSVVEDVDAVVDRELRFRLPLRTFAAVLVIAAAVATVLLPSAGAALLLVGGGGAGAAYLVARLGGRAERRAVALRAELSAHFVTADHVADELKMWQAGAVLLDPVAELSTRLAAASSRVATAVAAARALIQLAALGGVLGVTAVGVGALERGDISGPALALLLLLPVALAEVAGGVVEAGSIAGRVRAAEDRLAALGELVPAVLEPEVVREAPDSTVVGLEDVSVGWGEQPVCSGLDLTLRPGEHVAVVGPSGSGKSTVAATLIRFIDPLAGRVLLGGVPLDGLALATVRRTVGYVDDDPHIFATSLAENVRLARPDATDAEVRAALEEAHLGAWVDGLPAGLQTWLGDGHSAVSGGERARIGLARSLLLDQPVLVLDEPIAHLDTATAEQVCADLLTACDRRTVVWITHSNVGLDQVDRVVDLGVPDRGEGARRGSQILLDSREPEKVGP